MKAWAKDQGVEGSMLTFFADPTSDLTRALDVELKHPGPAQVLGPGRCKRFAMLFDDGVCKAVEISESENDPTGDGNPKNSLAPNMIELAKAL
mmetsp:Transcript_23990/g.95206  ORF Transcript_23990/g.95206 Transcript_23990/m.95206 type:complete len:93 (-) Transcript_23990:331-609(-)